MSAVANASIARKMFPVLWETGGEIAHHPPYAATPELRQTLRSHARPPTAPASGVQPEAETALCDWDYPGNVRELANVLERVLVLRDPHDPSPIDRDEVMAALCSAIRPAGAAPAAAALGEDRLADAVARVEKANIEAALRRTRGVKSHAARMLGISRPSLDEKLADFKLDIWARE